MYLYKASVRVYIYASYGGGGGGAGDIRIIYWIKTHLLCTITNNKTKHCYYYYIIHYPLHWQIMITCFKTWERAPSWKYAREWSLHIYITCVRHMPPSKHDTLALCWSNVGPPSATLAHHWVNISGVSRICKRRGRKPHFGKKRVVSFTLLRKMHENAILLSYAPPYAGSATEHRANRLYLLGSRPMSFRHSAFLNIACCYVGLHAKLWDSRVVNGLIIIVHITI